MRYRDSYLSEKGEIIGLVSVLKEEGKQEGSYNTLYSVIQTMRKNGIADKNIAKMMNLDICIVKKVLNREKIEIPLNLL